MIADKDEARINFITLEKCKANNRIVLGESEVEHKYSTKQFNSARQKFSYLPSTRENWKNHNSIQCYGLTENYTRPGTVPQGVFF